MGVTVGLAGSFRLTLDDGPGETAIGSAKERRLLALLAVHRDRTVSTDRIVDVLWNGRPPRRAAENVATLVSRLRAALGAEVILGGRGTYRLGEPPAVRVDLDVATRLVAEAVKRLEEDTPALGGTAATRAMDLLGTGSALAEEPDADWVAVARSEWRRLVRSARHAAAAAALRTGEAGAARELAAAAIAEDRFDETAHRLLLGAHRAAGEPSKAVEAYLQLRTELVEELGIEPAPETRAVYLAMLREERSVAATAAATPRSTARHVGRADELGSISAAWAAAGRGQPGLLLLVGEAGIGKTWLATEAAATAEETGGLVLSTRCYAAERSLFLQPFVDALAGPLTSMSPDRLRTIAGVHTDTLAGLVPEVAEMLGRTRPVERLSPEVELRRAYEAVTHTLRGMAESRPVLLVLDDLHNAGTATVELLHYLARHAGTARLLALATLRREEGAQAVDLLSDVAARTEVGPLGTAAVARLAAAAGQGDLTDVIVARTRGHPLFVVELLGGLVAGETGIPESLQAAVLARLRRAGPDVEELLRAGSVLGSSLDPDTVAGLLDLTPVEVARRCARAAAARLLVVAGRDYEFANDLVQEVLYATTPTPSRLVYHRRAADLLVGSPEAVAAHATASEDWPRAARASLLAGESAAYRGAVADAEALLGQALGAAERTGELDLVGRILVARGRAREALEAYRPALGDLRAGLRAARDSGDRRLEMIALRELGGDVPVALGLPIEDGVANLRAGLRIAESFGDRAAEADLLARLGVLAGHRLSFVEALSYGRRAAAAGRAAGVAGALVVGLDGLKTSYAYLGELDGLIEVVAELEPLARRLGDLFRLQWAVFEGAFPAIAAADWTAARARIGEAIELNRRSGYRGHEAWFVAHLGWVARLQGRPEEAAEHGRRAVAMSTAHRWWRPTAQALLATTLLEAGGIDEALSLLTDAVAHVGADGAAAYRLRCLAPLAEASGSPQVLDEADGLLRGIAAPAGSAWLLGADAYLAVARAWLHHATPDRARAVLVPLRTAATRQRWIPILAAEALVDGQACAALGDPAGARAALTRSLDLAMRRGLLGTAAGARAALADLG